MVKNYSRMSDDSLKRKRRTASRITISLKKEKEMEGKSAYMIYPAIAMPFTYPQSRAATHEKKEEKKNCGL